MNIEKNVKINLLLDQYGCLLSNKQKKIMEDYYMADLGLSEIASCNKTSRQSVLDLIKRSEAKLERLDRQFKLVEKKAAIIKLIDGNNYSREELINLIEDL